MLNAVSGNVFLMTSILVFVAVLLLLEGVFLLWKTHKGPRARQMDKRLRSLDAARDVRRQTALLKQRMLSDVPVLERLLHGLPRMHGLLVFIHQAGLNWTVSRLLLSCAAIGVMVFGAMVSLAHQSMILSSLAGAAMATSPVLYVSRKRAKRLARIEQQLPDTIDLIIRALRSGHAFSSGLKMVGDEMSEPIANEFRIVHDEVNFGVSMQQALLNLSRRVPITDLRYFIVAVLIQRESGGNLTEVLGNLSRLVRDRLKLNAKVRILSSEGRLSAWVLGIMPFALAALLNLVNPEFMSLLWNDPIGISIIKYMLILMAIGALILRHIIKIRV